MCKERALDHLEAGRREVGRCLDQEHLRESLLVICPERVSWKTVQRVMQSLPALLPPTPPSCPQQAECLQILEKSTVC